MSSPPASETAREAALASTKNPGAEPAADPGTPDPGVSPDLPAATSTTTLARSAGLVSVATMASRLLGLVREQVLLIAFGAGDHMDAFNVAFRLPNLVRDLFAEGAMSAAFVPTFTRELRERGKPAAWELGNLMMSGLLVATGIVSLIAIFFAGPITHWIAPQYGNVPGKLELTTSLTQVMFPFLTMIALAVASMGMLNALRWFFIPALAPAMFNVAAIASVFLVVPLMPRLGLDPMMGLAIGTLIGGAGQVLLQWPALRKEGFRFRFQFAPRDPRFLHIIWLMAPGTVGLAAVQINQLVNVWLATGQGTGAVTYLSTAFRLMYLPIGVFGVSIATAALPGIARHAAADDLRGVRDALSQALRMMLMLNVPATLGLIVLAVPIFELLIEYGRVSSRDTAGMAFALTCYAPGLLGYSAVKIASPTFYALKDSRTPVTVSLISIGINIVLNLTLVRFMGFGGLALGTGIAALVNAGLLFYLLRGRLGGIDGARVGTAFVKILIASIVMAAAAWGTEHGLSVWWPGHNAFIRLVRVMLAISAGVGTLVLMAKLLRLDEFEKASARVTKKLVGR
jgi:putative peptidoglycan lipid II flippase